VQLPDPRVRLARLIAHPRVAVSLVVLALGLTTLVITRPNLDSGPADSVQLAATAPVPSTYTSFSGKSLHFTAGAGTRSWNGRTYAYSTWTSSWVIPTRPFTELVPSWIATTPNGSALQVLVSVRDDKGATSTTKDLGHWALNDGTTKRASGGSQSDAVARVATDTVVATRRPLTAYRLTVRLLRVAAGASPTLSSIGAVTSQPSATLPTVSLPLKKAAVSLAVPRYSQMIHRGQAQQYGGGGEAWCSPTSLSMVLGYYGRLPAPSTYTWVPRSAADRWVDHVARLTYDYSYDGTGNWPFNTAYAATRTGSAFLTRLANLRMAERFIRAGIPLVLSIEFAKGQLPGAPISSTPGHLVVLTGFTAAGNPIVNDPAASSDAGVRRTYDRAAFERAWLRSWGTAYVVRDAKHPLPARPAGVKNW
jgi:hypothetical protein